MAKSKKSRAPSGLSVREKEVFLLLNGRKEKTIKKGRN